MTGTTKPNLSEARRLLEGGMKMVRLKDYTKQPVGKNWHRSPVRQIDSKATGYGQILELNGLCSIDPDHWELATKALAAVGMNLDELMSAGVRTNSTRPGSGGRSVFKAPQGLKYFKFSCEGVGTVFELRMGKRQDAIPGLVYRDRSGETHTQHYANGKRLDDAGELPPNLLSWWQLVSSDVDAKREQQRLMGEALGRRAHLSVSCGDGALAFRSRCRGAFNRNNKVEDLLIAHGYVEDDEVTGRYSPPNATGAPGVWSIETKDDLWESAHASDPLEGTFDAWSANVQLNFKGDLAVAEKNFVASQLAPDDFENFDVTDPMAAPAQSHRFKLLTSEEVAARPQPLWMMLGVLPTTGIAAVFGPSASGKSFLVLGMAAAVAEGRPWFGHRVREPRPVVYVALEGEAGFTNRVKAWEQHHGRPLPGGLRWVMEPFALTAREDAQQLALKIFEVVGAGALVFIDTLNRAAPGADENSSKDMSGILSATKELQRLVGGLVVLVHHAGKDETRGLRGHSSLFAAMDAVIEVKREKDARKWSVAKSKDGVDGGEHHFQLETVNLGTDPDGDTVTSCVVVTADPPDRTTKTLTPAQTLALDTLKEIACASPTGVRVEDWREAFYASSSAPSPEAKRQAFRLARGALEKGGYLTVQKNVYRPAGEGDFEDLSVSEDEAQHAT